MRRKSPQRRATISRRRRIEDFSIYDSEQQRGSREWRLGQMSSPADVLLVESNSSRQGGAVRSILMLSEHPGGGETGSPMWVIAEPPCSCLLLHWLQGAAQVRAGPPHQSGQPLLVQARPNPRRWLTPPQSRRSSSGVLTGPRRGLPWPFLCRAIHQCRWGLSPQTPLYS